MRERIGARLSAAARAEHERELAAARAQLDREAFPAAWAEGQALTLMEVVGDALEPPVAS